MQAQAYEGYFDGGKFYTGGKTINIPERKKVYIAVLDESVQDDSKKPSLEWLDELHRLLEESGDEKLCMEDFPRMETCRFNLGYTAACR